MVSWAGICWHWCPFEHWSRLHPYDSSSWRSKHSYVGWSLRSIEVSGILKIFQESLPLQKYFSSPHLGFHDRNCSRLSLIMSLSMKEALMSFHWHLLNSLQCLNRSFCLDVLYSYQLFLFVNPRIDLISFQSSIIIVIRSNVHALPVFLSNKLFKHNLISSVTFSKDNWSFHVSRSGSISRRTLLH